MDPYLLVIRSPRKFPFMSTAKHVRISISFPEPLKHNKFIYCTCMRAPIPVTHGAIVPRRLQASLARSSSSGPCCFSCVLQCSSDTEFLRISHIITSAQPGANFEGHDDASLAHPFAWRSPCLRLALRCHYADTLDSSSMRHEPLSGTSSHTAPLWRALRSGPCKHILCSGAYWKLDCE